MVERQPLDRARFRLKVISEFYGEPLMGELRLLFRRSIIQANWLTIGLSRADGAHPNDNS
jgi:hypothetical protein